MHNHMGCVAKFLYKILPQGCRQDEGQDQP